MKKPLRVILCSSLLLFFAGCDFWSIVWQGIIGKGYYQLTQSSIANQSASMTADPIDLTALSTSSVIIYRTSASSFYGKMSLITAPISGSLVIKFETYANDGTTKATSNSTSMQPGNSFDLEAGSVTSPGTSDFLFSAPGTLTPHSPAVFYIVLP